MKFCPVEGHLFPDDEFEETEDGWVHHHGVGNPHPTWGSTAGEIEIGTASIPSIPPATTYKPEVDLGRFARKADFSSFGLKR